VRCQGEAARVPEHLQKMLSGENGNVLDAHSIQPYYALRVAKAAGMSLDARGDDGEVVFTATPAG
ncbi:MAG: histidine phosphotransferase family protein, partial [Methyloligellaceae bacterium]